MESFEQLFTTLNEAVITEREICVGFYCNDCKMISIFMPGECSVEENDLYIHAADGSEGVVHIPMIEEVIYDESEDMYEVKAGAACFHINCC